MGPSCETRWSNSDKTDHHVVCDCLIFRHSNMQKWPRNERVVSHTDQSLIAYSKQSKTGSGERPRNEASVSSGVF